MSINWRSGLVLLISTTPGVALGVAYLETLRGDGLWTRWLLNAIVGGWVPPPPNHGGRRPPWLGSALSAVPCGAHFVRGRDRVAAATWSRPRLGRGRDQVASP